MNILILVGSLREGSWTAQLADVAAGLLPRDTQPTVYAGLADLPHYSQDLDLDESPEAVASFRAAVRAADALVVATPEYNGAMPGVLKNAIDWASRPRGTAALAGKPVAVLSVSPSPRGAQWAREDAVKVLRVAGARPLGDGLGVASVHTTISDGHLTDQHLERALGELMDDLVAAETRAA